MEYLFEEDRLMGGRSQYFFSPQAKAVETRFCVFPSLQPSVFADPVESMHEVLFRVCHPKHAGHAK